MEHREFESMIEQRLTEGGVPSERLLEHVRECRSCARLYQRYVEAERALCGSPDLSVLQRDRIEARLIQQKPKRSMVLPFALPLAAAAVAVLFFVAPNSEFSSRGDRTLSSSVELRALAIEPKREGGFDVNPASDRPLNRGDHLRLLYENRDDFDRVTVEIHGEGKRIVLLQDQPILRTEEAKLGDPIAVGDWPLGEVQIRAVFFRGENRAPIDAPASDGDGWAVRTIRTRVEMR